MAMEVGETKDVSEVDLGEASAFGESPKMHSHG